MLETVAEAFPEPVLKTYYFKHIPLGEGVTILNQMYYGRAAISTRTSTGDLLVHAPQDIQDKIAKNIAEFDVPRPAETESLPVAYDLSDIPATAITYTATSIRQALPQMIILPSSVPGQLIVWGKLADQQKVKSMVEQMLQERPAVASKMQTYSIHRGTAASVAPMIRLIVPNAQFGYGINPNQLLVWAKDADHAKIKDTIDKLNESDPLKKIETYPLKNIYAGAQTLLRNVIQTQGMDVQTYYDSYSNQLVVQAKAEDQKMISEVLEKLRTEDRELAVFSLETIDPQTAYMAIYTLFYDEPYSTTPGIEVDQNTNMIFVQGTKAQLEKTRKMLIRMGETQLQQQEPRAAQDLGTSQELGVSTPGLLEHAETSGATSSLNSPRSSMRVIQIKGDASDTIRELEKLWPQYQQNRLRVIRQDEPMIQKKEDIPAVPTSHHQPIGSQPVGLFSMNDPAERPENETPKETPNENSNENSNETLNETPKETPAEKIFEMPSLENLRNSVADKIQESAPNVYVIVNEDGSLTVTSHDTAALDQLERLVKRIDDRVVFEGRDFTIYSVRNISASLVVMKLNLILRERLAGRQQRFSTAATTRFQPPRLEILADESTNTINVRGAKSERTEVANLIALLDVSELPGERAVRKPIKVPIKNTQAVRVVQQIYNVYQQKIQSMRLPGGAYPRITVDNVTNSVEIIAPEPFATELKEYAEEIDRMTVEEPARKIHVIPLKVKSIIIQNAIQKIQMSSGNGYYPSPYAAPYSAPMPYRPQ
jgi:hypothetical protein